MEHVKRGLYQHYKGGRYNVIGVATHEATGEQLVIYESVDSAAQLWARSASVFAEQVDVDGVSRPRFALLSPKESV